MYCVATNIVVSLYAPEVKNPAALKLLCLKAINKNSNVRKTNIEELDTLLVWLKKYKNNVRNAFFYAIIHDQVHIVRRLSTLGDIDFNKPISWKNTPLTLALSALKFESAQVLVDYSDKKLVYQLLENAKKLNRPKQIEFLQRQLQ